VLLIFPGHESNIAGSRNLELVPGGIRRGADDLWVPSFIGALGGSMIRTFKGLRVVAGSLVAAAVLLSAGAVAAQQTQHRHATHRAETHHGLDAAMDAMFGVHGFQQAEISPDGKLVGWVETLTGPGGMPSANSAIYVAAADGSGEARRITAGSGKGEFEEHDIAWSPDSKKLAFLSDAGQRGQLQLYIIAIDGDGAAAKKVSSFKGFVSDPAWSPDGKQIALLFTENATRAAGPLVAETPDEGVVSDNFLEQRLTLVDPAVSRTREISPANMYAYEFDWAPDSKRLVVTAAPGNGDDNWYIANLFVVDASTSTMNPLTQKPEMQIGGPRWSKDGKTIAFIGGLMSDEPIVGGDVYIVPAVGGNPRDITPDMAATASSISWSADSSKILCAEYKNGVAAISAIAADGSANDTLQTFDGTIGSGGFGIQFSISSDDQVTAMVRESFDTPPEVWAGKMGDWKQVTHRNANLHPAWGKSESLEWTTDIGKVQGWLTYPRDFDPNKKYPLVVCVHGGPSWAVTPAWPQRWSYFMALPSQGYFLLQPNPRGSYGQGEKFTQANVKDFGGGDFRDIMAGVDAAIKAAPIDPNRLGITGWSYGGYMTMWAVTQTNRFEAAVSGAGLSDWLSYYGENKIDQWMTPFFGASVYDDPEVYAKSAPITFIKNVKTPTLVVVGDRDGECPPPQSYEFWHALKTLGVATELVIYPNEGHEFADPKHSRDVIERSVGWFNDYMQKSQ
jgi:dipeptidyl aminopeptidase/acylaminoacyl peptidase